MSTIAESVGRPGQSRFWRELVGIVAVLWMVFWLLDLALVRCERFLATDAVIDIASPGAFSARLHFLQHFSGRKVALLGDSVMLGNVLRDATQPDWIEHTPQRMIARQLAALTPQEPIAVVNLALNGALPADLAEVMRTLQHAQPQLVVADLGLRAFSNDFNQPHTQFTRAWLPRLDVNAQGEVRLWPERLTTVTRLSSRWDAWLAAHWRGYRIRDLARQHWLANDMQLLAKPWQQRAIAWGGGAMARPASAEDQENAALDLLMRASTRYRSISLSANHAQRLGLERFLTTAQQQRWPTFLFYTWESPEARESLLDEATYAARSAELHTVLQPYLSDRLRYSPGISDLPAERYLDHIHVDAAGYDRLFEQFASDLAKLWGP